ncbi:MAG: YlmH/Sll1252 family protein [Eubacteriales bacterium]
MNKQDDLLKNRLIELSRIAYEREISTFTDYLNLSEIDTLVCIPKNELYSKYELYGGYEYAERQMISFVPDALCYENIYPISALKVEVKALKYSEELTHRDYLGSLLGLGLDRSKIGDILILDTHTVIFVHECIANYVIEHFNKVKHTYILTSKLESCDLQFKPKFQEIKGTVASIRLDSILSLIMKESRSKLIKLIEGGKVYVNGRLITTNAYKLSEQDLISVRGHGKYQYDSLISTTKKDRLLVTVKKFI